MDMNTLAAGSDPMLVPTWIAAIGAVVAVPVSIVALLRSWRAADHADRSATAAEGSEREAKRSADAAERSVEIADEAKDAAVRSASAAEEQVALAKATAVEWEPQQNSERAVAFVNVGNEDAHNVLIEGGAIVGGPMTESIRRKGESLKIAYSRSSGLNPRIIISWDRPPENGGERQKWSHDLWPPNKRPSRMYVV